MSGADWWNSTPLTPEGMASSSATVEDPPGVPTETIPLQPRTLNEPLPARANLEPLPARSNLEAFPGRSNVEPLPARSNVEPLELPSNLKPLNPKPTNPKPTNPTTVSSNPPVLELPKPTTSVNNYADPDLSDSSRSRTPLLRSATPSPHLHPNSGTRGRFPNSNGHGNDGFGGEHGGPERGGDGHGYSSDGHHSHSNDGHSTEHGIDHTTEYDPNVPIWSTYHHEYHNKKVDMNSFKRNMNIAKGFLDISLLSANANQLRNLLSYGDRTQVHFYVAKFGLLTSIALQLATGVLLVIMERWNINKVHHHQWCLRMNNAVSVLVFLTLVLNVMVSSFGVDIMSTDFQITQFSQAEVARTVEGSNSSGVG